MVAKKFSIPHAISSIDALLKLPLDAVSLALPPDQVYAAATKVIRAGLPVLCEKPLGMNAEQARSVQMQASELVTAMDFLFAEVDEFQELKYLIDSRQLGNLRHINVLWLTESWAQRSLTWSWKSDIRRGGRHRGFVWHSPLLHGGVVIGAGSASFCQCGKASLQKFCTKWIATC